MAKMDPYQSDVSSEVDEEATDTYRTILNQTIANVCRTSPERTTSIHRFRSGQVGMSWWSSDDKQRLYEALARYGPYDLEHLRTRLPNHSELEINQYIQLLRAASDQHYLHGSAKSLVKYQDIPAAVEFPEELCDWLEIRADKVQAFQLSVEEQVEKKRFGKYWLLDGAIVDELDERSKSPASIEASERGPDNLNESDSIGVDRLRPALELLDLKTWLEISETVFNNAPADVIRVDGHGSHIPQPASWELLDTSRLSQYKSAFFATAFSDFHSVLVSLMRRIVCTVLFQAQSRLRATESRRNGASSANVTSGDVYAALDILGLPRDPKTFWASAARKNNLEVYDYVPNERMDSHLYGRDISRVRDVGTLLSYDEVENRLGLVRPGYAEQRQGQSKKRSKETNHANQSSTKSHQPNSTNPNSQHDDNLPSLPAETESDTHALAQEKLANAFDRTQSSDAAADICFYIFNADAPSLPRASPSSSSSSPASNISQNQNQNQSSQEKRTYAPRPTLTDLQNWREKSKLRYKPEWETYGYRVPFARSYADIRERKRSWSRGRRADFERRKRRRLDDDDGDDDQESSDKESKHSDDRNLSDDERTPPAERGRSRRRQTGSPQRTASKSRSGSRTRPRTQADASSDSDSLSPQEDDGYSTSSSLASQRGRRSTRSSPISYAVPPLEDAGGEAMAVDDAESSADDWVPE